ncbi:MAG TPA: pyridoxal-phosphate dependent enzyme, partial [Negativicutes bacterium]
MYATHLECPKCHIHQNYDQFAQLCPACGSPLLVRYDLSKIREAVKKEDIAKRRENLWRYRELLPLADPEAAVSLGEVMTPLLHLKKLGEQLGFSQLYLKDEGMNPGGTFKSRGAAVGVSRARELGITKLAMPTNGNAGAAWAIYCAKAGIEAYIVMPVDAPAITRNECA